MKSLSLNHLLKREANMLLYEYGLLNILAGMTKPENILVSGSYLLDVMAWRDLDIFINIHGIEQDDIYDTTSKVLKVFRPVWLETKNTFDDPSECPKGYFLGFETND